MDRIKLDTESKITNLQNDIITKLYPLIVGYMRIVTWLYIFYIFIIAIGLVYLIYGDDCKKGMICIGVGIIMFILSTVDRLTYKNIVNRTMIALVSSEKLKFEREHHCHTEATLIIDNNNFDNSKLRVCINGDHCKEFTFDKNSGFLNWDSLIDDTNIENT